MKWSHLISVEVPISPEDFEEVSVLLYVEGRPGAPATFTRSQGQWEPPDDRELDLLRIEMQDPDTGKWRKPVEASSGEIFNDHHVLAAVDEWWDDHCDECWESADV